MDTQTLANLLATLLAPVFLWLAGQGLVLARRWQINSTVARAIVRAAGAAIFSLKEEGRPIDNLALNRMVQVATDFVNNGPTVVPLLPKAGIDEARLEELIRAELGNRLPDLLNKAKAAP